MLEACSLGSAVAFSRYIYLLGGFRRSCLRYDPATDSWTRLSEPRQKHGNAPAVVWQGQILVAGGGDAKTKSSVIEHYDPVTNEWSDWTTPLNEKLNSHCMFSVILCGVWPSSQVSRLDAQAKCTSGCDQF